MGSPFFDCLHFQYGTNTNWMGSPYHSLVAKESNVQVDDIRVFIPSKDYEVSKSFYQALGFNMDYVSDDRTLFENGDCFFFLQRFYNQELANNLVLQLSVLDINEAYNRTDIRACPREEIHLSCLSTPWILKTNLAKSMPTTLIKGIWALHFLTVYTFNTAQIPIGWGVHIIR